MKDTSKFKQFLSNIVLTFTFIYLFFTVIYTLPSNYLKIRLSKVMNIYDIYFFQKWDFFSPPSVQDDLLFYSFYNEENQVVYTVEVLSSIFKKKQLHHPFNTKEEIIDYIIFGSMNSVSGIVQEYIKLAKFQYPDSTESYQLSVVNQLIKDIPWELHPSFQTLLNFGKLIVEEKAFDLKGQIENVKISFGKREIPRFSDVIQGNTEKINSIEPKVSFSSPLIKF